jgi:glycosyltransferase involved in cell wall biosynthesis
MQKIDTNQVIIQRLKKIVSSNQSPQELKTHQKISCVTRFMDRLSFIKQTLPTWLKFPYYEIIIVDWSSNEDILPLVKECHDQRVIVLKVKNQKYFDPGAAWNVGINYASGDFINCIDCDILINPVYYPVYFINQLKQNCLYLNELIDKNCTPLEWSQGLYGTNIFSKNMWDKVNGYIEGLESWGEEDVDFYRRLVKEGFETKQGWIQGFLTHIYHDDSYRVKHTKIKFENRKQCWQYNKKLIETGQLNYNKKSYNIEILDHTGNLKKEKLQELNQNCMETLYVSACGGLANRLRVLVGFWHVANIKKIKVVVFWSVEKHCNGKFTDMFKPLNSEQIFLIEDWQKFEEQSNHKIIYSYATIPEIIKTYIPETIPKNLIELWGTKFIQDIEKEYYSRLIPLFLISKTVNDYVSSLGNYVAMHIRRTDHVEYAKSVNCYTTDEEFDSFVKAHLDKNIFLATDNCDTQKKYPMTKTYKKIPEENVKLYRQTSLCDALIDILICTKATQFKGTAWSSFSNLIETFRNIKK